METPMSPAEETIRKLAKKHGVTAKRTALDDFAEDVSRLSDAGAASDEVEQLLVNLRRAEAIPGKEITLLHVSYLASLAA